MLSLAKKNKKADHNGQLFVFHSKKSSESYFSLLTAILPSAQIDEITHLNFSPTLK
jgi:hypothetical protein